MRVAQSLGPLTAGRSEVCENEREREELGAVMAAVMICMTWQLISLRGCSISFSWE